MDKLTIPKRLVGLEVVAILRQILGVFVVDNNTSTLLGKRHGLGHQKRKVRQLRLLWAAYVSN